MRKLHNLILSGTLTPCQCATTNILTKIDLLQIPQIKNKKQKLPANDISYSYLHHDNKCTLAQLSRHLKDEYLQEINVDKLADMQSQTHQAYRSLMKLDKIKVINNRYLKENNISGLRRLSEMLSAIVEA